MLWYWQGDGGSLLIARFMTMTEQRHKVPKLAKRVFTVFVYNDTKLCIMNYELNKICVRIKIIINV
jgi:hypothetical protein